MSPNWVRAESRGMSAFNARNFETPPVQSAAGPDTLVPRPREPADRLAGKSAPAAPLLPGKPNRRR